MPDYSRCAVCIGVAIAAIGLYLTIIVPLIATDRLSYMFSLGSAFRNLAVVIAFIASLPYVIKLYTYYRFIPEIHILYRGGLKISCEKLSKEVEVELEFGFLEMSEKTLPIINKLMEKGLIKREGRLPVGPPTSYKGKEMLLFPGLVHGLDVELEPETTMRVRLYPRVHLFEFGLPRFFGDVDLKPIDRIIVLDSNGTLSESNRDWIEREYGTTEDVMEFFK